MKTLCSSCNIKKTQQFWLKPSLAPNTHRRITSLQKTPGKAGLQKNTEVSLRGSMPCVEKLWEYFNFYAHLKPATKCNPQRKREAHASAQENNDFPATWFRGASVWSGPYTKVPTAYTANLTDQMVAFPSSQICAVNNFKWSICLKHVLTISWASHKGEWKMASLCKRGLYSLSMKVKCVTCQISMPWFNSVCWNSIMFSSKTPEQHCMLFVQTLSEIIVIIS